MCIVGLLVKSLDAIDVYRAPAIRADPAISSIYIAPHPTAPLNYLHDFQPFGERLKDHIAPRCEMEVDAWMDRLVNERTMSRRR